MKIMKYIIFLFVSGFILQGLSDTSDNRQRLLDTGFHLLEIETVDGEEPTSESVVAPIGCNGIGTVNATKVMGQLIIRDKDGILYDSGKYKEKKSGITIKIRGNTSATFDKKSFKLKLQKKADLLLRNDDNFKAKDWVLLPRGEFLYTAIGFEINRLVNLQWTPGYRYVNLMINGDIRGVYILVDAVERNSQGRIDVDEDTGYILEYDAYWWNEDVYFKTPYCSYNAGYTFKYPDPDDVTVEQIESISNVMDRVEKSVVVGDYHTQLEVDSFVAWLLAQDLLANADSAGSNIYLTKYDLNDSSIVKMGNLWDFDCIMQRTSWSLINQMDYFVFRSLLNSDNSLYRVAYRVKWERYREILQDGLDEFFLSWLNPMICSSYDAARVIDAERWGGDAYMCTSNDVFNLRTWFNNRMAWMDDHIDEICNGSTNVATWNLSDTTQIVFTVTNAMPVAWIEQTNYLVTVRTVLANGCDLSTDETRTVWMGAGTAISSIDMADVAPALAGRSLCGWEDDSIVIDASRTIVAQYTNNIYSIRYEDVLSDISTLPHTYTVDDEIVLPALPSVNGNAFIRWDVGQIERGTIGDIAVRAIYATSNWAGYNSADPFIGDRIVNYTGYIKDDDGAVTGIIQIRTAKVRKVGGSWCSKVTGTLQKIGQAKEKFSGTVDLETGAGNLKCNRGSSLNLYFGAGTVSGVCGNDVVVAVRNLSDYTGLAKKEVKNLAKMLTGSYVAALPQISAEGATNGWVCLSTIVKSSGNTSSTIYTADGKKNSSSCLLLVGQKYCTVIVTVREKGYMTQIYLLCIANDGSSVKIDGSEQWHVGKFRYAKLNGLVELPNGFMGERVHFSINRKTGIVTGGFYVPAAFLNTKRSIRFTMRGMLVDGIGKGMAIRSGYSSIPFLMK